MGNILRLVRRKPRNDKELETIKTNQIDEFDTFLSQKKKLEENIQKFKKKTKEYKNSHTFGVIKDFPIPVKLLNELENEFSKLNKLYGMSPLPYDLIDSQLKYVKVLQRKFYDAQIKLNNGEKIDNNDNTLENNMLSEEENIESSENDDVSATTLEVKKENIPETNCESSQNNDLSAITLEVKEENIPETNCESSENDSSNELEYNNEMNCNSSEDNSIENNITKNVQENSNAEIVIESVSLENKQKFDNNLNSIKNIDYNKLIPEIKEKEYVPKNDKIYSYNELKDLIPVEVVNSKSKQLKKEELLEILKDKKESHLTDEEFEVIFKYSRKDFYELPRWKQIEKKKSLKLF